MSEERHDVWPANLQLAKACASMIRSSSTVDSRPYRFSFSPCLLFLYMLLFLSNICCIRDVSVRLLLLMAFSLYTCIWYVVKLVTSEMEVGIDMCFVFRIRFGLFSLYMGAYKIDARESFVVKIAPYPN